MPILTRQEVALSVQDLLNVSDPDLLDVNVGGLQGQTLRRAAAGEHKLTGVVVHTVLQAQVGHLPGDNSTHVSEGQLDCRKLWRTL